MNLKYLLLLSPLFTLTSAKQKPIDTSSYSNICGDQFPLLGNRGHKIMQTLLPLVGRTALKASATPQHDALCWIIHLDPAKPTANNKQKLLQRYALATLYSATMGNKWIVSTDWLSVKDECQWFGITCGSVIWSRKRVTGVSLPFNNLVGILPRDIRLLKHLRELDLKANEIQGVIPNGIGEMKELRVLRLHMNGFFGSVPTEIGSLKNLRELNLYGNYFTGKIPAALGKLVNLEILDLYANNLGGSIPTEFGKMRRLQEAYLNDNNFSGTISKTMLKKMKLSELWADCRGPKPEVTCESCTVCCQDDANPKCESRVKSKKKKATTNKKKKKVTK